MNNQGYLQYQFEKRKAANPNFSLRSFAKWLNISPAQLSQLLSGKRRVTLKMAEKISGKLDLSPAEKKLFFENLFSQEKAETKDTNCNLLDEDTFRVISDWYHFAILSLGEIKGSSSDPRWIARRLGISVNQAREAFDRLNKLGLIKKFADGSFKQAMPALQALSQVPSAAIRRYHLQNLDNAKEKLQSIAMELRDFSSITMAADESKLPLAKECIMKFKRELAEILESGKSNEVYTLAVQLFPITIKGKTT